MTGQVNHTWILAPTTVLSLLLRLGGIFTAQADSTWQIISFEALILAPVSLFWDERHC